MQILTINLLLLAGARKTSFEIKVGIVRHNGVTHAKQPSEVSDDFFQVLSCADVFKGHRYILAHPRGESCGPSNACVIYVLDARIRVHHIHGDLNGVTRERQCMVGTPRREAVRFEVDANETHFGI